MRLFGFSSLTFLLKWLHFGGAAATADAATEHWGREH